MEVEVVIEAVVIVVIEGVVIEVIIAISSQYVATAEERVTSQMNVDIQPWTRRIRISLRLSHNNARRQSPSQEVRQEKSKYFHFINFFFITYLNYLMKPSNFLFNSKILESWHVQLYIQQAKRQTGFSLQHRAPESGIQPPLVENFSILSQNLEFSKKICFRHPPNSHLEYSYLKRRRNVESHRSTHRNRHD